MKLTEIPTHAIPKTDYAMRGYYVALTLIVLVSIWVRAAFPISAIGHASYDDMLFIKLAASIGQGQWLGEYNDLTHAKGVGYPIFILVNHITGLPLKFSEHVLYLIAALFFSSLLGKVYQTKWATLLTFLVLAFIPTAWNPSVGGRVIREGLYVSLSLFLLGLGIRCFVMQKAIPIIDELREKWRFLVLLGFVAGAYWLTREEGVWLLPSMTVLVGYWAWMRRSMLLHCKPALFFVCLPVLPALITVGTVDLLNYSKYGVFRNNDFRSEDFQAAYGALSRIKHDEWRRYVVFPKDARERAYRFSEAARELAPAFEGVTGEKWRREGCTQTKITPCPEILSGWFMWALRDATSAAGHYRNAREARDFYLRLASEINAACDQHPGECLPYRKTQVPPWRHHYFQDTLRASNDIFNTLIKFGDTPVGVTPSVGTPTQMAIFALATNGPIAPTEQAEALSRQMGPKLVSFRDTLRLAIARRLADAERSFAEVGIPAVLFLWFVWLILALLRRKIDVGLIIASTLVAALASRVLLLGFLEATSIPSNNMLYLSPVAPMALALIPVVLFGLIAIVRGNQHITFSWLRQICTKVKT